MWNDNEVKYGHKNYMMMMIFFEARVVKNLQNLDM